ncbi:hypothetical protein O181_059584 [Austropuccinia psidii MF-1]|uniref:Reverse transcriptase Ty1/copia-type domain-containing protein n=1 Tax=Austropuccinia psidii MF-1 TaxID=1389203 RepID=A0A9Q3EEJ8_9BASI|nr:hypothetical protein [Austropuccinia psidii MF-1]
MTVISHLPANTTLWNDAMKQADRMGFFPNDELHNLTTRGVIKTVLLPRGKREIGFSVQLKCKFYTDNRLVKNKVRTCAQGFSQQPGVDYDNTFSPIGKFISLRALLAIYSNNNLEINHMDAMEAFLNPSLKEEIYLNITTFVRRNDKNKFWRFK